MNKNNNKNKRHIIQFAYMAITNGYILGFLQGKIFQGNTKVICVPGLNCYSCPGALGSCPVGSLQAVLAGQGNYFSYYVLGFLVLFGVVLGRVVCGFLCPFGLVQDLIYKIKTKKIKVPQKADNILRKVKYAVLLLFVILFPMFLTNQFGLGTPYFCKWICPSGTLFGGIPLIATNESLRQIVGALFSWKLFVLVVVLVLSVLIYRPFCKYLCPLGAFYALFNKVSIIKLNLDEHKCVKCGACNKACKMNVVVTKDINAAECIRCGDCKSVCKYGAIKSKIELWDKHAPQMPK